MSQLPTETQNAPTATLTSHAMLVPWDSLPGASGW